MILYVSVLILVVLSLCFIIALGIVLYNPRLSADLAYLTDMTRLGMKLSRCETRKPAPYTIIDDFEKVARKSPEKVFLIYEGRRYTYSEVNITANKIANAAKRCGFKCGDKVKINISFQITLERVSQGCFNQFCFLKDKLPCSHHEICVKKDNSKFSL